MYKKILFPVDNSENTKRAFYHVTALAETFKAKIVLLHAYQVIGEIVNVLGEQVSYIEELNQTKTSDGETILRPYIDELKIKNLSFESIVVKGEPDAEIVRYADSGVDLVVLGNEGMKSYWNRFFMGSTSENVVHHIKCPVLLIP